MYRLSKALLNSYTKIKGEILPSNIRIYSVCPGNVLSPMSVEEEYEDMLPPDEAINCILKIAYTSEFFESGKFYKNCEEIPW